MTMAYQSRPDLGQNLPLVDTTQIMRTAPKAPTSNILTDIAKDMDRAAKQAAAGRPDLGTLSDAALQGVSRFARAGETPLLVDLMRDGVVTAVEAQCVADKLPSTPLSQARIDVLLRSKDVVFATGARETLAKSFGLPAQGADEDALSPAKQQKLSKAIDDAQWAHRSSESPIGSTDDNAPIDRPQRWVGENRLTTFIVDLVSDGYMTMEKAKKMSATFNCHPENIAGVAALLQSTDVIFLPGTKAELQYAFDLRPRA
jgi:hypothetical protein